MLLVLGLLAGMVALSLHGAAERAQLIDAVGAFGQHERLTREIARHGEQPLQMVVHLDAGRVERVHAATQQPRGQPLQLPGRFRFEQLWLAEQRLLAGQIAIPCSRRGYTPSYAVQITDGRQGSGQQRWLVVAGLSGQITEIDDEKGVRDILGMDRPPATDEATLLESGADAD